MPWGPQDVRGRIQIRVFFVTTAQTHKLAQCGPAVPVYMPALTAGLTGVRYHHIENKNALVPQHLDQLGGCSFQQHPVQPRFLPDIRPRILYRSPGSPLRDSFSTFTVDAYDQWGKEEGGVSADFSSFQT